MPIIDVRDSDKSENEYKFDGSDLVLCTDGTDVFLRDTSTGEETVICTADSDIENVIKALELIYNK